MDSIGGYKVMNTIGHGRFGVVLKATTSDSINIVAIKKIPIEEIFEEDLVGDMKNVIVNMQKLHHKNIIGAHEVIKSDKHICMVMSYVSGLRLIDRMESGGKFSSSICMKYSMQICDALAYSHSQGISNRNINPWNVIIDTNDNVKLAGFDMVNSSLIGDQVYGDFIAPEIRDPELQKGSGAKQDMWAFGILVYFMRMGKMPLDCFQPFGKSILSKLHMRPNKHLRQVVNNVVVVLPEDRKSAETVLAYEWFYS